MEELTLFNHPRSKTPFEKWMDTAHGQEAFRRFVKIALAVKAVGMRIGAKAIWERMRWNI